MSAVDVDSWLREFERVNARNPLLHGFSPSGVEYRVPISVTDVCEETGEFEVCVDPGDRMIPHGVFAELCESRASRDRFTECGIEIPQGLEVVDEGMPFAWCWTIRVRERDESDERRFCGVLYDEGERAAFGR